MVHPYRYLLLIFIFLFNSVPSWAQNPQILTAQQVKEMALEKNVAIQIANVDLNIGKQNIPAVRSIYDTILNANVFYFEDKSARTTDVFGTDNNTTVYNFQVLQKTPTGTEISAGFLNQRDNTNSIFATVNPAYDSAVAFSLRQPVAGRQ